MGYVLSPMAYFASPMDIVTLLFVLGAVGIGARLRAGGYSLVLRQFDLYCEPLAADKPRLVIVGRKPGLIAFMLTLLGLEAQTTFSVTSRGVECQNASLFGNLHTLVPLSRVASVRAGTSKPIGYLVVAAVLLFGGSMVSIGSRSAIVATISLLLAAVAIVVYILSKSMVLEVKSNAGVEISLRFKPSVLEGMPIDVTKALAAAGIIRDLVLQGSVPDASRLALPSVAEPSRPPWPPVPSIEPVERAQEQPAAMAPPLVLPAVSVASNDPHDALPASPQFIEEDLAHEELRVAVAAYRGGRVEEAAQAFAHIVRQYPGTTAASTAQKNLAKIAGR